jgi:dTDP-4-amino-4,6-dideoxygalactose transaminase
MRTQVQFLDLGYTYRALASELEAATSRVLASGWYVGGPEVEAFEQQFAEAVGARYCVGVGNGLDALTLVLRAWQVGPGDDVVVPAHTFIATWLAVTAVGANLVPIDPTHDGFNVDITTVEPALTDRTRVVVPVHLYGAAVDIEPLAKLAKARGFKLLEDAAQAHLASGFGQRVGALGEASAWSFYPGKNLGAYGDGGAVTTNDRNLADSIRAFRSYGSQVKYQHELLGVNSRLDAIQAAILGVKLKHLKAWNAQRREIAERYNEALKGLGWLKTPALDKGSVWHLYVVESSERNRLQQYLTEQGVQTLIHYPVPPHRQKAYATSPVARVSLPRSEALGETVLSLPMGPHLSNDDVTHVIDAVRRFPERAP